MIDVLVPAGRAADAARPAGRRAPGTLSLVVLLLLGLLGLLGCDPLPNGSAAREGAGRAGAPSGVTCEAVRTAFPCRTVEVDGQVHRYLIGKVSRRPDERIVLVDLGGPGRSLFTDRRADSFVRAWPGDETLLFVEEPWVTRPLLPQCRSALRDVNHSLRAERPDDGIGERLVGRCGLSDPGTWGWTPSTYRDVVRAAVRAEEGDLVGVVGTSFGAPRSRLLWDEAEVRWVVLNSPAPAPVPAGRYLDERRRAALKALREGCTTCAGRAAEPTALLARAGRRLADQPVELATRTPAVEPVDLAAAVVGLPYLSPVERQALVDGIQKSVLAVAPQIAQLSDSVLLRYGDDDLSPALLAYYDEVCRQYVQWPTSIRSDDLVGELLARLHAPCADLPSPVPTVPPAPSAPVCIATATDDHVTPSALTSTWSAVLPRARRLRLPSAGHASPGGAAGCYAQFARDGGTRLRSVS